jgi:hypothetical protein
MRADRRAAALRLRARQAQRGRRLRLVAGAEQEDQQKGGAAQLGLRRRTGAATSAARPRLRGVR